MSVAEQLLGTATPADTLTRDLLVRASHARHGEGRALQFRVLHLNLPVVAEVADRLGLSDVERTRVEHAALDGLLEAVRLFDPYGEAEFAAFAAPLVERQIRACLTVAATGPTRTGRRTVMRAISARTPARVVEPVVEPVVERGSVNAGR